MLPQFSSSTGSLLEKWTLASIQTYWIRICIFNKLPSLIRVCITRWEASPAPKQLFKPQSHLGSIVSLLCFSRQTSREPAVCKPTSVMLYKVNVQMKENTDDFINVLCKEKEKSRSEGAALGRRSFLSPIQWFWAVFPASCGHNWAPPSVGQSPSCWGNHSKQNRQKCLPPRSFHSHAERK